MGATTTSPARAANAAALSPLAAGLAGPLSAAATSFLRYTLAAILLYFGAFKFTAVEAEAIRPLISESPLMAWTYAWLSAQAVSNLIGVAEIAVALGMLARPLAPRAAGYASLAAAATFAVTLSFLATTPGMWMSIPEFPLPLPSPMGSFIVKDVFLLGAALVVAGEAFAAARRTQGER